MSVKMAAVWGSPGSGKKITAVKIAKELAEQRQNVILASGDFETPLLPLLLPSGSDLPSIGDVLSMPTLSQIAVLQHCVSYGKNQYISLLGYGRGENVMSYPEYDLQRAEELLVQLRSLADLADIVLIDCSSHLDNYLTAAALKRADVTLRIVNADPKSMIYFQSAAPLLQRDSGYRYNSQINVLNNLLPSQDPAPVKEILGEIGYKLPNVPELKAQYDSAQLSDAVFGRTARQYAMEIKKLVKEVFLHEPEHGIVRRRKPAAGDVPGTA